MSNKSNVRALPGAQVSIETAAEIARQRVNPSSPAFLAAWFDADGHIAYTMVGTPGALLWLAQTIAVSLPLGIADDPPAGTELDS